MESLENLIVQKLAELEQSHNFKILYACESGSRAWGFPSPNSDYDVRFIYVHDLDWHLSLFDKKDTLDLPISNELDIGGWEIKKTLSLLRRSNAPLLEWIQSPIVYHDNAQFLKAIWRLSQDFFSPIAVVKLKKYFYALRTTIAGKWVREEGTMPHIELSKMLGKVNNEVRLKIYELIALKAHKNEDYLHFREPLIDNFLEKEILLNEQIANNLPANKGEIDKLDNFYRKVVKGTVR